MDFGSFDWYAALSYLQRIAAAFILALPIGWEREKAGQSAGLRTFPLVAMATCSYVLLGERDFAAEPLARSRIIEGVITGMGFIGGGAILKQGSIVSGTATAASIWSTGAVGAAVALGRFEIAIILSLLNVATLRLLTPFKARNRNSSKTPVTVERDDNLP